MIKCNDCEDCYVNTNSDEAYCEANDGEQIILHKGQCRPRWCPRNIHGKHADFMKIDEAVEGVDNTGKWVGAREFCQHLEEVTGEKYQTTGIGNMIYCNQCWQASRRRSKYCPDCGCQMTGGEDNDL